jgi:excisionase family DNA binding protein
LKVGKSNEETKQQKVLSASDVQLEVIKQKDFLSIKEAYTLLGVSERTFYRLMKEGTIPATKLGIVRNSSPVSLKSLTSLSW